MAEGGEGGASDDPGCIPGLHRLNSLMGVSIYDIADAVRQDNLGLFTDLVQRFRDNAGSEDINFNLVQGDDYGHSALVHVIAEIGRADFFRELVRVYPRQVNVDLPHQTSSHRPLHLAAQGGHHAMIRVLLEHSADVNARMAGASTALHIVANMSGASWLSGDSEKDVVAADDKRLEFARCAKELVRWGANIDALDSLGFPPLYYATGSTGSDEVTTALLKAGACATTEVENEETMEMMPLADYIQSTRPGALEGVDLEANRVDRNAAEDKLFQVLYAEAYEPASFKDKWKEASDNNNRPINANKDNGSYTFLQYCCDQGHADLVKFLLDECGADPNMTCASNPFPPLVLAAYHGYYKVLEVFKNYTGPKPVLFSARTKVKKENVFHQVLKGESKAYINVKFRDYSRCMDVLLDPKIRDKIQPAVNSRDFLGNSPLHIAAALHNIPAIKALLRREANIGLKNRWGETPIAMIPADVMKEFLDECLESEGIASERNFKLTFRYSFLGPPMSGAADRQDDKVDDEDGDQPDQSKNSHRLIPLGSGSPGPAGDSSHHDCESDNVGDLPEAEPLWYMSRLPEHRKLLTHPVISSFLGLKWARIKRYYYWNLVAYLAFVACLTAYVVQLNVKQATQPWSGLSAVTLILLIALAIREVFQALVSFRRYVFSLENLLEVVMIGCSLYLVCAPDASGENRSLSSAVIMMAWTEMVLMFGRHPTLSTYIAMLFRVSANFIKVLAWYFSIIVAFGLAFFVLLKRPEDPGKKEQDNEHFADPATSLMKTIVMSLTGEIEYEGIQFGEDGPFKAFGQIVFLLWVFFVMLVLNNLLNGLAVQDIGVIQKEAEVVSAASQVELIAFIESMLLGDPFQFLTNWPQYWCWDRTCIPKCDCLGRFYRQRWIRESLNLLIGPTLLLNNSKGSLLGKKAVFMPNMPNWTNKEMGRFAGVDLPEAFDDDCEEDREKVSRKDQMVLESSILESAKLLAVEKRENDSKGSSSSSLGEIQSRIKQIEKGLLLLTKQQNFIIEKLNATT